GVFCSAMVYHDTRRPLWHIARCGPRFLLSAAALGLATTLLAGVGVAAYAADLDFAHLLERWGSAACLGLAAIMGLKLALESAVLGHLVQATHTPLRRTAMLLIGPLLRPVVARYGLALLG